MTDFNHDPVTLPAASFDLSLLQKELDKAAKGKPEKYDDAVSTAIGKAGDRIAEIQDPRDIPGFKFVDVDREDLGVTETIQVFDAKLAEEQGLTGEDPEADIRNQQAEVVADATSKAN